VFDGQHFKTSIRFLILLKERRRGEIGVGSRLQRGREKSPPEIQDSSLFSVTLLFPSSLVSGSAVRNSHLNFRHNDVQIGLCVREGVCERANAD